MSELKRIEDQLRRAMEGEAWHGPSLREILEDVTAEQAARRPIPAAHSIWEIVLHVTVWESVVARRLGGEVIVDLTPDQDWPRPQALDETAWLRLTSLRRVTSYTFRCTCTTDPANHRLSIGPRRRPYKGPPEHV